MPIPWGEPGRWDEEAQFAVRYTHDSLIYAWRGAFPWLIRGICVIFGNVGYGQDECAKQEVVVLRRMLNDQHVRELGFATSEDEDSWAMLVRTESADELTNMIWKAAAESNSPGGTGSHYVVQRPCADDATAIFARAPKVSRSEFSIYLRACVRIILSAVRGCQRRWERPRYGR